MEVTIERMDHQGRGIGYIDGKIVFVERALPGEIVDIEITKEKKNYNEAIVKKIVKSSNDRVESVCPYFELCGGCDLLHLNYESQLNYKETKVKDIIKKYAGLPEEKVAKIVPSSKQFEYRNKITLKNNGKIGYHKKGTNEVVNIEKCLLANSSINETILKMSKENIDTNINEIMIRDINGVDKAILLTLQNEETFEKTVENFQKYCSKVDVVSQKNKYFKTLKSNIIGRLDKKEFEVSPTAFFQVNTEQTVNLYNKIVEEIKKIESPKVLDLYCGTGTIGIYISDFTNEVIGVEINPDSIDNANRNKDKNNTKNIKFMVGDTKKVLSEFHGKIDVVIVDPPRAGLDNEVVLDLIKIAPKKIIYISCDPVTLARDLNLLKEYYDVNFVIPFDMFPNTYHVESFCSLTKI